MDPLIIEDASSGILATIIRNLTRCVPEDNGVAGVECERCPGASSDSGASLPGHSARYAQSGESPRDASIRSSSPPLAVETVLQKLVLVDASWSFSSCRGKERSRGVRWINSVKVVSLLSLFFSCFRILERYTRIVGRIRRFFSYSGTKHGWKHVLTKRSLPSRWW